jgi:primosomal protein N''
MEEARAVLARLERIEALEREGALAPALLAELRELVREATEWAERERDPRAREAAAALADAERSVDEYPSPALHRSHQQSLPSALAAAPIE